MKLTIICKVSVFAYYSAEALAASGNENLKMEVTGK